LTVETALAPAVIEPLVSSPEVTISPDASLLSPEVASRLAQLSILSRRMADARRRGRRKNRRPGGGAELLDTRPYVVGDDPRRIAWSAYARLERLVVRLAADEAPLRLALVLDTSASMRFGAPTKLRQATRIAAGLAAVALSGEDRVAAVASSSRGVESLRAGGGRAGMAKLFAMLDGLGADGETDLSAAAAAATQAAGGRALCVILGDLLDPKGALAGARAARMRGHEVTIVEVLDPFEIDPPELDGLDLEDDETGEIVVMPAHGARAAYKEALAEHRARVDEGAAELGAPVLRVSTAEPFDEVIGHALAQGLLRGGGLQ
jgi:uncharacterized protein (DUF58 family)